MGETRLWTNRMPVGKLVVMGVDVGGTNTNVALALQGKSPSILISFHYATRDLKGLEGPVSDALQFAREHKLTVKRGCIAAAGPVVNGRVKGLNIPFVIDAVAVSKKMKVKFSLINDFEAIGRGMGVIPKKDILTIQNGRQVKGAPQVIVGAGSGLGKSVLAYDAAVKSYVPLPSEGGHADFAFYPEEFDMCRFFARSGRCPDENSMVSGRGIEAIYTFLRPMALGNRMVDEVDQAADKAKLISSIT